VVSGASDFVEYGTQREHHGSAAAEENIGQLDVPM
jgi:hypothetical protein